MGSVVRPCRRGVWGWGGWYGLDVSEGEGPSGGEGRKEGGDVVRRSVGRWVDERRGEVGRGCLSVVDSQMGCARGGLDVSEGEGPRLKCHRMSECHRCHVTVMRSLGNGYGDTGRQRQACLAPMVNS